MIRPWELAGTRHLSAAEEAIMAEFGDAFIPIQHGQDPVWATAFSNMDAPLGLCAERTDHKPHTVNEGSLAPFICTADQTQREPYRSEARRGAAS